MDISWNWEWQTEPYTAKFLQQLNLEPKVNISPIRSDDHNVPDLSNIGNYVECTSSEDIYINTNGKTENNLCIEDELSRMFENDINQDNLKSKPNLETKSSRVRKAQKKEGLQERIVRIFGSDLDDLIPAKKREPEKIKDRRRRSLPVSINLPNDLLKPLKVSQKRKSETDVSVPCKVAKSQVLDVNFTSAANLVIPTTYTEVAKVVCIEPKHEIEMATVNDKPPVGESEQIQTTIDLTLDDSESVDQAFSFNDIRIEVIKDEKAEACSSEQASVPVSTASMPLLSPESPAQAEAVIIQSKIQDAAVSIPQSKIQDAAASPQRNANTVIVAQQPPPPQYQRVITQQPLPQVQVGTDTTITPIPQQKQTSKPRQRTPRQSSTETVQSSVQNATANGQYCPEKTTEKTRYSLQNATANTQHCPQKTTENGQYHIEFENHILRTLQQQESMKRRYSENMQWQAQKKLASGQTVPIQTVENVQWQAQQKLTSGQTVPNQTLEKVQWQARKRLAAGQIAPNQTLESVQWQAQKKLATGQTAPNQTLQNVQWQAQKNLSTGQTLLNQSLENVQWQAQKKSVTGQTVPNQTDNVQGRQGPTMRPPVWVPPPPYNIQNQPFLPQLSRLQAHNGYLIITNEACADRMVPYILKFLHYRATILKYWDELKTIFPAHKEQERQAKFRLSTEHDLQILGMELINDLSTVNVQNYDLFHIFTLIAMKVTEKNQQMTMWRVCSLVGLMVGPCEQHCKTPFTRRFFNDIKVFNQKYEVKSRMEEKARREKARLEEMRRKEEPIMTQSQLARLTMQIQQYWQINTWLKSHYKGAHGNSVPSGASNNAVPPVQGQLYASNTAQLQTSQSVQEPAPNYTVSSVQSQPNRNLHRSSSLPDNPQQRSILRNINSTVETISASRVPETTNNTIFTQYNRSSSVPESPLRTILGNTETNSVHASVQRVTETAVSDNTVSSAQDQNRMCNNENSAQASKEPETEAQPKTKIETDVIDLTWIDDADEKDILDEIIECKAFPFKTEDCTAEGESSNREGASPVDSGLGSPVAAQAESNNDLKCLCNKKAIYICACNATMYCSTECQIEDWVYHQKMCHKK